jgi:DNA-binding XRE family transcriptional regulator
VRSGASTVAEDANFWGKLVKELRAEFRMSQRELARHARVNRSTLRRLEDGIAGCNINIVERLLNTLGYDLDALPREGRLERLRRRAAMVTDPVKRSEFAAQILFEMTI